MIATALGNTSLKGFFDLVIYAKVNSRAEKTFRLVLPSLVTLSGIE
jgi:hypothetical protein